MEFKEIKKFIDSREICHIGSVRSVATFGDYIVSGSDDRTVKLWSIKEKKLIHTFEGHKAFVNSVAIEGDYIVSGSSDETVKLWRIKEKRLIRELESEGKVYSTSIDRELIYYSDDFGIVGIEFKGDIADFELVNEDSGVSDFDVSGKYLVYVTFSGKLVVGEIVETKEELKEKKEFYKTLVLGNTGVGKTSLCYYLTYGKKAKIHSTHGMRFFNVLIDDKEFFIWDFGGQPMYQLSHKQNFDNAKVILFLVDGGKSEEENSVNFWINSIKEHIDKLKDNFYVFVCITKKKNDDLLKSVKEKLKKLKKIKNFNINSVTIEKLDENYINQLKDKLKNVEDVRYFQSFEVSAIEDIKSKIKTMIVLRDISEGERGYYQAIEFLKEVGVIEEMEC
ncbi:ADP-ribosylation factor-like protein [Caminibacter sp.]